MRNSSATAKLKWNNGDLKAAQGDMGHAEPTMIMKVYSAIRDEDRRVMAQKFESAFYQTDEADSVNDKAHRELNKVEIVSLLEQNPEIANQLIQLLSLANK